jgi:predicted transglutaminase-like cysteine proteinase
MGYGMRALALAAALAAITVCSGCVTVTPAAQWRALGERPAQTLAVDAPASAPRGLLAYCARARGECNPATSDHPADHVRGDAHRRIAWQPDAGARFQLLMASRAAEPGREAQPRVALNEPRLAELFAVNRAILFATDRAIYGVEERWTRPLADLAPGQTAFGDCEDFALEKRAELLARGWDPGALSLAVADAPNIGLHAVLVVATDRGDLVLDNYYDTPRPLDRLSYRWLTRQVGPGLTNWARTHAAPLEAEGRRAVYARLSAEGAMP